MKLDPSDETKCHGHPPKKQMLIATLIFDGTLDTDARASSLNPLRHKNPYGCHICVGRRSDGTSFEFRTRLVRKTVRVLNIATQIHVEIQIKALLRRRFTLDHRHGLKNVEALQRQVKRQKLPRWYRRDRNGDTWCQ